MTQWKLKHEMKITLTFHIRICVDRTGSNTLAPMTSEMRKYYDRGIRES